MMTWWQHPLVISAGRGAVIGFWSAAVVDLQVFVKSPTWRVDGFKWATATKRWATGALVGALGGLGLGQF